jgi:hypothetical protein
MTACEQCWDDAYLQTRLGLGGGDRVAVYRRLVGGQDTHPCTPEQQAGQFWDTGRQADIRDLEETTP